MTNRIVNFRIQTPIPMSNKTRSILKVVAVILVLVAVLMNLGWIRIPSLNQYQFWYVVIGFGLLLVSSK
jgi:hypothetical protein